MKNKHVRVNELPIQPADPNSPVPLYHQIETSLRRFIQKGHLVPGDVLPPEIELSRAFDVGRHTMRVALARLADDGLIERKAGRGTIVTKQTDRVQFFLDRSFTRQMADMGRESHSQVLQSFTGTIDADSPAPLREYSGSRFFYVIRLRFGDEEPIGLQKTTIILDRCPDIERFDFNRESLYELLSREYKLAIHEITHCVSAALADKLEADLLQIRENDPLLLVKTKAFLTDGQLIEYTTSLYRADRYEYHTRDTYSRC